MTTPLPFTLFLCSAAAALATSLQAADVDASNHVSVELNATQQQDGACVLSFLAQNGHATDIQTLVYEAVLFDAQGQVDRLTLFDFGTLPAQRPRVRQFVVPDLSCTGLSRVLINGASDCAGDGVTPDMCTSGLTLSSRTETELLG